MVKLAITFVLEGETGTSVDYELASMATKGGMALAADFVGECYVPEASDGPTLPDPNKSMAVAECGCDAACIEGFGTEQ